ncbi:MAG: N-acyl-D-amino-acid deacylase [Chloroflexota bacterium]|jgi:N-acyl-D-amino-acid deacylase|nr:N-acyl-D-amino-acid deacylase [Chloroflexota bacterium]
MRGEMTTDERRYELLIVDGTVVDGTGAPGFAGAIGVTREAAGASARSAVLRDAAAIEDAIGRAARIVHAKGKVVAPGFIDLHSHSGLMILAEPRHEPKVRQGVTTEVVGVDGLSYAPITSPDHLAELVEMNAGLDGYPDIAFDWDSVESYLDRFDRGLGVNIAFLIGNSALRLAAIGWDEREATAADEATMRSMLVEGMEQGAYGISSGLDYPPGAYASTGELSNLARAAARLGGFYHSHVRYALGDRFLDPFREAIDIGRRGDAPSHITHFYHRATFPGTPEQMLALVDDARAEGLDVTFDAYPYEWASTRLLITVPPWVQAGGPGPTKERLADRSVRDRIRTELRERGVLYAGAGGIADIRLGYFGRAENLAYEGRTLGDIGKERGGDLVNVLCDLLLSEGLRINQVTPGPNLPGIRRFYQHPVAMVGTDSTFVGAKPSPRSYGSYPRILGQFVRDEALLSLEQAVAKMTSMPAARLGLRDRGRIADGLVADLVVFDPATVGANATYDEPRRFSGGIDHVIVNGTLVVEDGAHTGALPGRALRRGRD